MINYCTKNLKIIVKMPKNALLTIAAHSRYRLAEAMALNNIANIYAVALKADSRRRYTALRCFKKRNRAFPQTRFAVFVLSLMALMCGLYHSVFDGCVYVTP